MSHRKSILLILTEYRLDYASQWHIDDERGPTAICV